MIITKGDKLVYCANYFTRKNKNFFFDIKEYARITQFKINHTPLCPCKTCEKEMQIYRKDGTRQYFWICFATDKHIKPKYRRWDYGLSDLDKDFLGIRRKKTQVYKKKNQKALKETGKPLPIPKATTRKVRDIGRPENLKN